MDKLNHAPEGYRDIVPVFEEERPGTALPRTRPRPTWCGLLRDHHFPDGRMPQADHDLARHRHGTRLAARADEGGRLPRRHEPGLARRSRTSPSKDQIIRQAVELDGYTVIVVQIPRPERPAGRAAALAEHRPGDGAGGFDRLG